MTVKKTHLLRNSIIIMLVFAIAGLALTYVKFFGNPDPTAATATMEFTFEGAADGIAPNGSQFNLSGITNEEVLSAALAECGMAEKYTVEQLQECLVARGVYPDNFVQQVTSYESLLDFNSNHEAANTNYHATTFSVELYNDFDKSISREQLETLLKAIVSSYKSFFSRAYANGLDRDDLTKLADMDYSHQLDAIETYCNTLAVYAQEMFARRPAFRFEGEGFNDISVRLKNLAASDVARLKADMTLNALTRQADRLESQYAFEIGDLENQRTSQKDYLDRLDKLIDSYEKNGIVYVSSGNNLNRIDNNANITYDTLVSQRKEVSDSLTDISASTAAYHQRLADLTGSADSIIAQSEAEIEQAADGSEAPAQSAVDPAVTRAAQATLLERNIETLLANCNSILDDFDNMLKAFNSKEINDSTVSVTKYTYVAPQILSGTFAVAAIKTAGPICAIGFMICLLMIIHVRRKQQRQLNAQ